MLVNVSNIKNSRTELQNTEFTSDARSKTQNSKQINHPTSNGIKLIKKKKHKILHSISNKEQGIGSIYMSLYVKNCYGYR